MSIWTKTYKTKHFSNEPFPKGHPLEGHDYRFHLSYTHQFGEHIPYLYLYEVIPENEMHSYGTFSLYYDYKYLGQGYSRKDVLFKEDENVFLRPLRYVNTDNVKLNAGNSGIISPKDTDSIVRPFYLTYYRKGRTVSDKVSWILLEYYQDLYMVFNDILREFYKNTPYVPYAERKKQYYREKRKGN